MGTVKGFIEQGSTTTPFDMTVLNESSRFDLVIRLLERLAEKEGKDVMSTEYAPLMTEFQAKLKEHAAYVWEHGEDNARDQELGGEGQVKDVQGEGKAV